jgi:arabinogalactan oligomer/maltooligosaccharide transport system permease protein
MNLAGIRPGRVIAGLAFALIVAAGAGLWFQSARLNRQGGDQAERSAIVSLRALTELVERVGLEAGELQAGVARLAAADPQIETARVIRFKGIRLMASTAPEDTGDSAAPRKMAREEKPLYDLGQALRASVDQNLQEGRAWKEEIDVQVRDDGALALAAPLEESGQVVGAVLLDLKPQIPRGAVSWGAAAGALLIPLALFLALLPLLRARPLAMVLVAALLVVGAAWFLAGHAQRQLGEQLAAAERDTVELLTAKRQQVGGVLAELGLPEEPALDATAWDADRFRRPRGRVTAQGPDEAALAESITGLAGASRKFLIPTGILALALLGWVGLGGMARTGAILKRHRQAYFYVVPAMLGMLLLVFLPFSYGILLSFTNSNIYNTNAGLGEIWIGFENFLDILSDLKVVESTPEGRLFDYQNFYWTLGFTIIWTISNVTIGVALGLLLALILNTRGFALKPIYRVLLILPWAVPNYITALIWQGMFHSQFGVINHAIQMFGGEAISWWDKPFTAFITVLATNGWLSFPFMMVISLGALQSIPADLYEAARVDGATRWQQFKTITLPSLKPALVPAVILSVIWTFNQFNVIYLVSGGEPGGSTEILITEAYKLAFEQYRYGYAAAYSVVIFAILLVYGVWQNRVTRATEGI